MKKLQVLSMGATASEFAEGVKASLKAHILTKPLDRAGTPYKRGFTSSNPRWTIEGSTISSAAYPGVLNTLYAVRRHQEESPQMTVVRATENTKACISFPTGRLCVAVEGNIDGDTAVKGALYDIDFAGGAFVQRGYARGEPLYLPDAPPNAFDSLQPAKFDFVINTQAANVTYTPTPATIGTIYDSTGVDQSDWLGSFGGDWIGNHGSPRIGFDIVPAFPGSEDYADWVSPNPTDRVWFVAPTMRLRLRLTDADVFHAEIVDHPDGGVSVLSPAYFTHMKSNLASPPTYTIKNISRSDKTVNGSVSYPQRQSDSVGGGTLVTVTGSGPYVGDGTNYYTDGAFSLCGKQVDTSPDYVELRKHITLEYVGNYTTFTFSYTYDITVRLASGVNLVLFSGGEGGLSSTVSGSFVLFSTSGAYMPIMKLIFSNGVFTVAAVLTSPTETTYVLCDRSEELCRVVVDETNAVGTHVASWIPFNYTFAMLGTTDTRTNTVDMTGFPTGTLAISSQHRQPEFIDYTSSKVVYLPRTFVGGATATLRAIVFDRADDGTWSGAAIDGPSVSGTNTNTYFRLARV